MTNAKDVRWLVVGTSDIVRKRAAAAMRDATGSTIAGFVGGIDRAQTLAATLGGQAWNNLEAALDQSDCDAVYIGTPVYRHETEAKLAIDAGKPVLIEKPLGVDAAMAHRIADAAEAKNVTAGCAYYRRCFPRYAHARELLSQNQFGKVTLVRTSASGWFNPTADDPKLWRLDRAKSGGGPLADFGVHMFDLIIGLFGLPESVFAYTDTLVQNYNVEDASAVVMKLKNGAHVLASFGWSSKVESHEFEVLGSEARLRWHPADRGVVELTLGQDRQEIDLPPAKNMHQPLIEDFINAMRDGRPPISPLREAALTNVLLDAIYESGRTGREVQLASTNL